MYKGIPLRECDARDERYVLLSLRSMRLTIYLALALAATAAHPDNTLSVEEREQGWSLLFDGQSLDRWRTYQDDVVAEQWHVAEGELRLSGGGGGDLITREKYTNFELQLEWQISARGNSGIFILADESAKRIYVNAPEIQILDDARHPDNQLANHRSGSLYDLVAAPHESLLPAGDWNHARVRVANRVLSVWHNGHHVTTIDLDDKPWRKLVEASKFAQWQGFGRNERGHIGLQDHGDPVSFKNIKILALDASVER